MSRYYSVEVITRDGRLWHGDWTPTKDGKLRVGSAYGSAIVEVHEDGFPTSAAQTALARIVAEYARRLAEDPASALDCDEED